ncbi:hypothetical protein M9H77_09033 [Catharanthus roseus]|uniref:Uncharacterized protein n=1 Tax=Catharanthus roseus TaxID=4058 RepID=A0ACC0BZF5_CATRO|nr:hypothetical protein M9H77_09033 [Catharanthus roseus]
MKFLEIVAYLNVSSYPFTSIFLIVYCFLPALPLFSCQILCPDSERHLSHLPSGHHINSLHACCARVQVVRHFIRKVVGNELFRFIGGTSAHLAAVLQGLLKFFFFLNQARPKIRYEIILLVQGFGV